MNSRMRVAPHSVPCLVLLLSLGLLVTKAAAGQSISGFYRVVNTTDLGTDERVTLDIRLVNSSEDRVLVTKLDLRFTHFEQSAVKFASETLEPHGSLSVTQEVTVLKREYQSWQSGVRPYLLLTVQIGANQETTLTLALLRRPG